MPVVQQGGVPGQGSTGWYTGRAGYTRVHTTTHRARPLSALPPVRPAVPVSHPAAVLQLVGTLVVVGLPRRGLRSGSLGSLESSSETPPGPPREAWNPPLGRLWTTSGSLESSSGTPSGPPWEAWNRARIAQNRQKSGFVTFRGFAQNGQNRHFCQESEPGIPAGKPECQKVT